MRTMTAITAAVTAAAITGLAALPASASPARPAPHRHVLCARSGRSPCLTVRSWHARARLRAGSGTPVRVTPAGRVGNAWPFQRSPWLNQVLHGLRLVQFRAGRHCAGGTANGLVRLRRCSYRSLWVRGWFAPHVWVSVAASDVNGLPCALAAISGSRYLYAVTLNGHAMGLQEWAPRRGR